VKVQQLQDSDRISSILWFFDSMVETLNQYQVHVLSSSVAPFHFVHPTNAEILEAFRDLRIELDKEVVLSLVAAIEAEIRKDYLLRATRKKRSTAVGKKFRVLYSRYKERIRLEDLVITWRDVVGPSNLFNELLRLIKHRHWLAHGRYWIEKPALKVTPVEVIALVKQLEGDVSDFPLGYSSCSELVHTTTSQLRMLPMLSVRAIESQCASCSAASSGPERWSRSQGAVGPVQSSANMRRK